MCSVFEYNLNKIASMLINDHRNVGKKLVHIRTDVTNHEQCDVFECGYHYFCNFVLTIFPKSYYREE